MAEGAHYHDEGIGQIGAYSRLLEDLVSGISRHGFEEHCGPNGQLWARGNGWALLGLVETAVMLPPSDPARAYELPIFPEDLDGYVELSRELKNPIALDRT